MYVVVANLGDPGTTTDWVAIGPFTVEAAADAVMDDINQVALAGIITLDRAMVVPITSYTDVVGPTSPGLSEFLRRLQSGE